MEIIKIAAEFVVCSCIVCSALNTEIKKDDLSFTRTICKSSLGEENISCWGSLLGLSTYWKDSGSNLLLMHLYYSVSQYFHVSMEVRLRHIRRNWVARLYVVIPDWFSSAQI